MPPFAHAHVAIPFYIPAYPAIDAKPFSSSSPPSTATTPSQMRHFYGVDSVNLAGIIGDGTGQTIAIVDTYDDPNAKNDLQHFDAFYGLSDPPSFLKYNENGQLLASSGGTATPPTTGATGNGWQIETSLDIEWAHVIAPGANIALIEANTPSNTDLFAAVTAAATIPHAVSVSMSWGATEFSGEGNNDGTFNATGLVYLAATGDSGENYTDYPAASANVVAVGGTTMHFASGTTDGTYSSETAWSQTGGRISLYESKPSYQNAVLSGTKRGTPDVSMDADPNTGVAIYDSFDFGSSIPWAQYGGTSLATPLWAALIAIADQGRAAENLAPLSGRTGALPALYGAPAADFHDVTSGSNGTGNVATVGYDTVTGIGTPVANKLLNDISGVAAGNRLLFTLLPGTTVAGTAIDGASGVQVSIVNPVGSTVTTDNSTVTLKLNGGTFAGGGTTVTSQAASGVATFTGLKINTVGSYTLTATDGTLGAATSPSFNITPAAVSSLTLATGPSSTTSGTAISPAVVVKLFDAFGNLATTDTSSVTMSVASGPGSLTGTTTVQASNGSATFSNLILNTIGTYTIQPTDGGINGPVSSSFTISVGPAAQLAFVQQPTSTNAGSVLSPAVTVQVEDKGGNYITSVTPTITVTISSGTFADGSTTESLLAGGGQAVFSSLLINNPGTYTLTASGGPFTSAVSNMFTLSTADVINATTASHTISLMRAADGQNMEWTLGSQSGAYPISDPNGLTINGDGGNDSIYLDYANGNPLPPITHFKGTFTLDRLQGPTPLNGNLLDIGQSTLYFVYSTGSSPIAGIQAALLSGYNAGAWNGSAASPNGAIMSSAAAGAALNTYGIGYADGADGMVAGQPANTIEVRYTVVGDANLDRTVDGTDAVMVTRNYMIAGRSAWDQGNFNYDSSVNLTDINLLQKNYGMTFTAASVAAASGASSPTAGTSSPDSTSQTTTSTSSTSDGSSLTDESFSDLHGKRRGKARHT